MSELQQAALQQFTEYQCSIAFTCTILQVRRRKKRLGLPLEKPLSYEAMQEVAMLHIDKPAALVAKLYNCDHQDIIKARYNLAKKKPYSKPSVEEVLPWLATGLSIEIIADTLQCSKRHIKSIAKAQLVLPLSKHTRLSTIEEEQIAKDLLSKNWTQKELAAHYAVSQAAISNLNPNKIKRAPYNRLTPEKWKELLAKVGKVPITDLAKEYNINRSAIYQKLKGV